MEISQIDFVSLILLCALVNVGVYIHLFSSINQNQ